MKNSVFLVALLITLVACKQTLTTSSSLENTQNQALVAVSHADNAALIQAFESKKSNIFIEGNGIVKKLLPDDNKGARHQKFLVRISGAQSLLFAHNIDLAPSVPLAVGDAIQFRGEYVYNPKGGVMHWTHHDPQAKIVGGWIKHHEKIYQ